MHLAATDSAHAAAASNPSTGTASDASRGAATDRTTTIRAAIGPATLATVSATTLSPGVSGCRATSAAAASSATIACLAAL